MGRPKALGVSILIFIPVGCATNKAFTPTPIEDESRSELQVTPPLLVSLVDIRGDQEDKDAILQTVKSSLTRIYGSSIQWTSPFAKIPDNRVAAHLSIKQMSSEFGIRRVSVPVILENNQTAIAAAGDYWHGSVAAITSKQQTLAQTEMAQGYWVGTAWINVRLVDNRKGATFNIPLVSEATENNTWGYASATSAGRSAWRKITPQLINLFDTVLMKLRDEK
jgi:hypothetical protein